MFGFYLMEKSPNGWDDVKFNTLSKVQLDRINPCNEDWPYEDNSVIIDILLVDCLWTYPRTE